MSNLFLIRHGESLANADKDVYQQMDDWEIPLTSKGEQDAEQTAKQVVDIMLKAEATYNTPGSINTYCNLYYSSYIRAKQTADIILPIIQKKKIQPQNVIETPLCRERDWGDRNDKDFPKGFFNKPKQGESYADCLQRAALFHEGVISKSRYDTNIVIAHGEFIKLYMMYLLNWSVKDYYRYKWPRNGEVFLIKHSKTTYISSLTPLELL